MTFIVGIDPSAKKLAIVAGETTTRTYKVATYDLYDKGVTRSSPFTVHESMKAITHFLVEVSPMMTPERFSYVEKSLVGRGGIDATMKQSYVGGVLQACLVAHGLDVELVNVSTWRSRLGIKGKGTAALKVATRQFVQATDPKLFALVEADSDLTDAAAIYLHGAREVEAGRRVLDARLARRIVQGAGRPAVVRTARVRPAVR